MSALKMASVLLAMASEKLASQKLYRLGDCFIVNYHAVNALQLYTVNFLGIPLSFKFGS